MHGRYSNWYSNTFGWNSNSLFLCVEYKILCRNFVGNRSFLHNSVEIASMKCDSKFTLFGVISRQYFMQFWIKNSKNTAAEVWGWGNRIPFNLNVDKMNIISCVTAFL
jgi:hypothetical protein